MGQALIDLGREEYASTRRNVRDGLQTAPQGEQAAAAEVLQGRNDQTNIICQRRH